jgi:AcrR family transcriptional regulator
MTKDPSMSQPGSTEQERPRSTRGRKKQAESKTRELLLDVAEAVFSEQGYDSTAIIEITNRAGVNQALIRYYFGSKQGLFTAIYLRRGHQLSEKRIALLNELESGNKTPTIEEIIRAWMTPSMEMRRTAGGLAYMRLQARLTNEVTDYALKMRREVHDEAAGRYISAFQRARPDIDPKAMYWRMIFMLGCFFYGMSDSNRLETMSAGKVKNTNNDELFRQMMSFLIGGLTAPLLKK